MKTLILLRHSDTEHSYSGQKDIERELTSVGISNAINKGNKLNNRDLSINLITVSSAKRTIQTAELVAEQIGFNIRNIAPREEIYLASTRTMLSEINLIDDKFETVLMVSHNPGTEFIAEYITGEAIGYVETSGAICIQFDIDSWQEVSQANGKLLWKDFTNN